MNEIEQEAKLYQITYNKNNPELTQKVIAQIKFIINSLLKIYGSVPKCGDTNLFCLAGLVKQKHEEESYNNFGGIIYSLEQILEIKTPYNENHSDIFEETSVKFTEKQILDKEDKNNQSQPSSGLRLG